MPARFLSRRRWLASAAALLAGLAVAPAGAESAWPARPLTFVVAAGAGSSVDVFARLLAERLQRSLGQAVIVEARPGGNGVIGTQAVTSARPDGYTFLFAGNSVLVINPLMTKNLPFDIEKALVAVAPVSYVPLAIAVSTHSPVKSIQDLVASAKTQDTFFATPGSASLSRLIGENLNQRAGTRLVNVAYPTGGAAQTDVIGGRVPVLIDGLGGIAPHAKGGRLRLLAVSTEKRSKEFPDVPTIAEAVPGLVVPGINSLMAPAGTPPAILDTLNAKVREVLAAPDVAQRFVDMGGEVAMGSRAELDQILKGQRVLFRELITRANIKQD
ncbi:tripartite tricarboxylate transporter substrate binding protein [Ramlibacter sp. G-1-2-2]|uniref:Tripartite tricarboxylate transporter substrate binding protein n=1 Tax=Ramlibacter agri TaxID=2728837 RepID=A0A848H460_9BURK|nr:tripartite tricarboxylate transporter substrate binding protein [Ramlibacter agri]NML44299.1 tripartite tricarboxylate transporter substrate binding protein [Ramlibacter agri]